MPACFQLWGIAKMTSYWNLQEPYNINNNFRWKNHISYPSLNRKMTPSMLTNILLRSKHHTRSVPPSKELYTFEVENEHPGPRGSRYCKYVMWSSTVGVCWSVSPWFPLKLWNVCSSFDFMFSELYRSVLIWELLMSARTYANLQLILLLLC